MIKLDFETMYNTRDFCCDLSNNREVKSHLLLRSDNTAYASVNDIKNFQEYGIRTIIDIRSNLERTEEPDALEKMPDFDYHFFHFDCNNFAYFLSRDPTKLSSTLYEGYISLLSEHLTIKRIIDQISHSLLNGGVLFHCSGGKDRTGLISMLVQMILGVDINVILRDYHETYFNLSQSQVVQKWMKKYGTEFVYCDPSLMNQTICELIKRYGSVKEYLFYCGVRESTIENLRDVLIQE